MPWTSDDDLLSQPLETAPVKTRQYALSDTDLQRLVNAKLGDVIPTGRTVVEVASACRGLANRTSPLQAVLRSLRSVLTIADEDERDERLDALIARGTP